MAFFKDILDSLKLSDDDDFDMDDYDDYREAELEKERKKAERAQKKEASRAKRKADYEDDEDEAPVSPVPKTTRKPAAATRSGSLNERSETSSTPRAGFRFSQQNQPAAAPAPAPASSARSVSRPAPVRSSAGARGGMEVSIMKPTCFEDSQDICDALVAGKPIIVNLENFDVELAQRVMDFVCGCLYSINGKLHQISGYIFIVSPDEVDISGDYLALMRQDGFGVPTFNRKL
ncbi:MAG: cell division protein SepF [Lachnospiraceae bacterium]|nr:cell division protein SepF [Lachnospiraceae bacterium]